MKNVQAGMLRLAMLLAVAACVLPAQEALQSLTAITGEQGVHGMLPPVKAKSKAAFESANGGVMSNLTPALIYHGGPVMTTATTYAIYWGPPKLQTGAASSYSANYQNIVNAMLSLYPGHGIANNNTQYYMRTTSGILTFTNYIQNAGSFAGSYVDTTAYPGSGCSNSYTPGNCLSDAQIQAEVTKVMALKGWTGGLNHIFFVFTSNGEGSCASFGCSYSDYCAYHGSFASGSTTILYGNMPYANAYCQAGSSPNSDFAGDSEASITSHELTEAITDPELNAWYSASGDEIGDLCAWNYGTNTWDGGLANQSWPVSFSPFFVIGHPPVSAFELQQQYNNHTASCVQVGP